MASSIAQNVLMALTVTANEYYSSKVQAVRRREGGRWPKSPATGVAPATTRGDLPRRSLVLSPAVVVAAAASTTPSLPQVSDSASELLKRYLKKSEENKEKNDKERMESYYKRNYKDYFDFAEGGLRAKSEDKLSEAEKGILDWLNRNK
ncbi:hypothetical protein MLD38_013426 [Melastoma candidum]|uniref:Uncharacterized protein n=1 Tax=Melastoma candidum TaxID=119954 RepID=A0ACB9RAT9_9MYRT|nr:hypothetical protein MLD38_013426 [Melastoma candidum]